MGDLFIVILPLISQTDLIGHAYTFKVFDKFAEINTTGDKIALRVQTAQLFIFGVEMRPYVGDGRAKGFENETVGIVPNPNRVLRVMHNQLFIAVRKKTFNFWCFVNLDVPQKKLVLQVPNLKFFSCVGNEQMRGEGDLKYVEIDD